jgi:hypothetical protein
VACGGVGDPVAAGSQGGGDGLSLRRFVLNNEDDLVAGIDAVAVAASSGRLAETSAAVATAVCRPGRVRDGDYDRDILHIDVTGCDPRSLSGPPGEHQAALQFATRPQSGSLAV